MSADSTQATYRFRWAEWGSPEFYDVFENRYRKMCEENKDTEGRMKPKNCTCSGVYHHDDSCPAHCLFPTGCINDPCSGRIGHDTECCTFRGTVATNGEPERDFNLGALRDAEKIYSEIAERAAFARKVLKQAGITPGLGLDVWSHNVEHYAAQVAGQLPVLISSVERVQNGRE